MRLTRLLSVMLLTLAGMTATYVAEAAPNGAGSFRSVIYALNANDREAVGSHLTPDFQLTFTGGTTVDGDEALDMLMLLDTPISIVSVESTGDLTGVGIVRFGDEPDEYVIEYTIAVNNQFSTWTIESPGEPSS
jgi:hypothetical protein